ncbi:NFX1-type zinc finger-containing protein 1 [Trichoderma ghanense]|uniref:NFX1-type zinc finger-containing protein 1 n=1 Tax=Trichoderma ghanense TaxID=65468 RepID=A0ABY2GPM8_9HYPO
MSFRAYPTPPTTPSEGSLKPCFYFLRNNTCKFGARCKFSHDAGSSTQTIRQPNGRHPGAPSSLPGNRYDRPSEGKLSKWKRILKSGQDTARPSQAIVSQFLSLAVELMDGDVGGAQETIRLLVTEAGLSFVKDVIDRHIPVDNISITGIRLWETEIKPLFQLVTHPRVVDSAVLEQEVAAIFNFLVGVGGARMNKLLHYVVSLFQQWPPTSSQGSLIEAVELSLAVLAKMLDCNTTNIINEAFSEFANSLASPLDKPEEPEEMLHRLQAKKHLHYIRQRLQIGDQLPDLATRPQASVTQETFTLTRDLPGRLSLGGPRHNNDHANIAHIKILPTYEEIMSPREEYLPTNDCSQWHIAGIRGRLDREFRLIREDTVGQLRDAVRDAFGHIRGATGGIGRQTNSNNLRTFTYGSATLIDVQFDTNAGLDLIVRCEQPPAVRALSARQRRDWWESSKRLQAGALVCVLDGTDSVMFCIVSESTMRNKDDKKDRFEKKSADEDLEAPQKSEPLTLSDNESYLHVNLQLIDSNQDDVTQALDWYKSIGSSRHKYLVEFPGILLASFKHTLDALKQMSQKPRMPFVDLLAPTNVTTTEVDLQPPLYARRAGFAFDIRCITNDKTELLVSPQRPLNPRLIESRTTLDRTQSSALLNTLSRELSLIQGPPGTGKSYSGEKIIKVLLANKRRTSIGPILCVCYTNHALDQLLEHLLDDGTAKIIRVGSRSKSERLQTLNLRVVAQKSDRTRSERGSLWDIQQELNELKDSMQESLRRLSTSDSPQSIKMFLAHHFPRHHDALFGMEEDGWQKVGHAPQKALRRWLTGGSRDNTQCRRIGALRETRLHAMTNAERQALHRDWLDSIVAPIVREITGLQEEYARLMERRGRVRSDVDLRCLEQADVIGVTTTGLAKNLDLLRKLRCKVMLCEEAGEVLEAHILTALLPSIEHAILIGDHLQLRPQIQDYELQSTNPRGRQYSLDTSLFERLVEPPHLTDLRLPFSTLETQRRMHPSISELIRSTLYPSLQDGENVLAYPKVVGMKERLFWLHHEHLEAGAASHDPLNTSHSNDFEVELTVSLISHLVKQGEYSQDDIAVITPYLGQLHKLRRRMQSMFEICLNDRDLAELEDFEDKDGEAPTTAKWKQSGKTTLLKSVRAATVDNFQGEEAKVIIISLVRSNLQKRCGFLSTSNRINVLLSRAKHGMYIIGNSSTYYNVPMWEQVIDMLTASGRLGTSLELQCSRHPDTPIRVSEPDHFLQFSPESGCNLPCDKRLHCGHSCTGRCHSDVLHNVVECLEPCPRPRKGCDHACPRRCGQSCPAKCTVELKQTNLLLPCGHRLSSPKCWENQDPSAVRCRVLVRRTVPGCSHEVEVRCHEDVTTATYQCTAMCGHSHATAEKTGRSHSRTTASAHRDAAGVIRHVSTAALNAATAMLNVLLVKPPVRCAVDIRDAQRRATSPVPPVRRILAIRVALIRGAQCHALRHATGFRARDAAIESWTVAISCASEAVRSMCVDFLEMKEYHEIDLDEEPCIFPDCGHFLTTSSMDGQMGMGTYYDMDEEGHPTRLSKTSEPFSLDKSGIPVCATCRGSLRNIARYGRIVRRAILDESTKKFLAWSHEQYLSLADRLIKEEEKLAQATAGQGAQDNAASSALKGGQLIGSAPRLKQLRDLQRIVGKGRYDCIIELWRQIGAHAKNVRQEEQPFQKVADLVQFANRQNKASREEFRYDESVIQVKGSLLADALLLKCEIAILFDFHRWMTQGGLAQAETEVKLDLSVHWSDSVRLIEQSRLLKYAREEVQGHVFAAQLCGLCLSFDESASMWSAHKGVKKEQTAGNLKEEALSQIQQARALLAQYPSTASFQGEIGNVEMLINGGIYRRVTAEEMRAVYSAMTREFSGTGHWYTCENNHPFTIGECGMPMQEARCPECGARIGGQNHQAVEGMRHATEIENLARGMNGLGL